MIVSYFADKNHLIQRSVEFQKYFTNSTFTEDYCNANNHYQERCDSNKNGILDCTNIDNLNNLPCLISQTDFSNILIKFPKDRFENFDGKFYARQESSNFLESFNYQSNKNDAKINHSKFMKKLKLYGTMYDLTELKELTSEMTEVVEIMADTVYLNPNSPLEISYYIDIKARIVSINSPLIMNMSKTQFLDKKSKESWAFKEEFYKVGNLSMHRLDFGLVKILLASTDGIIEGACKPKVVSVEDADFDISDWFDITAINLQYVYARSLYNSGTNKKLVNSIAKFMLGFVYNSPVVRQPKLYYAAQKFLHLTELNAMNNIHNVPSFSVRTISQFSNVMYESMNKYRDDQRVQELELVLATGRVEDMFIQFKMFQIQQQSYIDTELSILNSIFDSSRTSSKFNYDHRKLIEKKTRFALEVIKNNTEAIQQRSILKSLRQARQSQDHMEEVIQKSTEHLSRLRNTFFVSKDVLVAYYKDFKDYIRDIKRIKPEIEKEMAKWKEREMKMAILNIFTSILTLGVAETSGGNNRGKRETAYVNSTHKDDIADDYIFKPKLKIDKITDNLKSIFIRKKRNAYAVVKALIELAKMIVELIKVFKSFSAFNEIMETLRFDIGDDISIDMSLDYRKTLTTATNLKLQAPKFINLKVFGEIVLERMNQMTRNELSSVIDMQKALMGASETGELMITEASHTADILLKLLKTKGELEISLNDKKRTIKEIQKIESELKDFKTKLIQTLERKEQAKLEYESDLDELNTNYNTATNSQKQQYRMKVTSSFNKLKTAVEFFETNYFNQISSLQTSIHQKFIGLRDHSMNQRFQVLDLFMNYCDVEFYHSFTSCENLGFPSISDDFGVILDKLSNLKWNAILSDYKIDGTPQEFSEQFTIDPTTEMNPTGNKSLIVQTFKEKGHVYINLKNLEEGQELLKRFRRIRVETIKMKLLDQNTSTIYNKNSKDLNGDKIIIKIEYPTQFVDYDKDYRAHSFLGQRFSCASEYGRGKYSNTIFIK